MDPKLSIKGSGYTRFQNRFTLIYKQHKFVAGVDSECVEWQDVCLREEKNVRTYCWTTGIGLGNPVFIRGPTAGTDIRQHIGGIFKVTVACGIRVMAKQFIRQSIK